MASITITDIDDDLERRLMERALEHGRSIEVEAREILEDALVRGGGPVAVPANLYDAIRAIVEPLGGVELEPFPRQPIREPPKAQNPQPFPDWAP
jgi:plasmid stability protein